jgi:hypothetical protein
MHYSEGKHLFLAALFAVVGVHGHVCAAADERIYTVYHRLGATAAAGGFTERGSIVLSADASTSDGDGDGAPKAALALSIAATNAADCIDPAAVDDMIASHSMYTIQVVDEATGQAAMASVPGCDVRRANFREELELTLSESGSLLSVTYTPLVSPLAPSCASLAPLAEAEGAVPEFQTSVSYGTSKPAMTVPLVLPKVKPPPGLKLYPRKKPAAGIGGGEGVDGAGAGGNGGGSAAAFEEEEKPQNQSFLMKYWYIILPLMILQFVGGPEPPPQQGEGGDGEGEGGNAAAAAGGAVAAGAAAAPRQRRGKRD